MELISFSSIIHRLCGERAEPPCPACPLRNAQRNAALFLYGRISGVRVLVAWWAAGWIFRCGSAVSKESRAKLRE